MGNGRPLSKADARASLSGLIKAQAFGLGFDLAGITSLGPAATAEPFDEWLSRGYAGDMDYLARGAEKRHDTRLPLPGAVNAIVVGLNYGGTSPSGPIARYARGDDYHDVMWRMLDTLHEWIDKQIGSAVRGKSYVDTGPILERDLARKAGLGWHGKNTNLINPKLGSFFFIGALLIDLELESDAPFEADRCGTCTRCIEACPTDALREPLVLDANRCISYLTIETKSAVPETLRRDVGDLLYGCDICQDVCPWNVSFSADLTNDALAPRASLAGDSHALARRFISLDAETFREDFRNSAMKRAKLRGLKRNAALVLGNIGNRDDIPALTVATGDESEMVADHARWALAEIQSRRHL
ncbi:MAG: tRNA epoxyqueuosine(34) reductase QueG [Gemmatimonadaceae bacterium]